MSLTFDAKYEKKVVHEKLMYTIFFINLHYNGSS